jgi:predicted RNA methylase
MVRMLQLQPGDKILEPCAGDGVFVDALLAALPLCNIDVYEINPGSIKILKQKNAMHPNVRIVHADTLLDTELSLKSMWGGGYDKVIANPPYGAWQDYEKRKILKKLFPALYVKETYSLFLHQSIALLRDSGRLVFIIPDTFLNLHMHKALRQYILTRTKIREISLFPSFFFPGVNFGYANLSIITLEKCSSEESCLNNSFSVVSGFKRVEELGHSKLSHLKVSNFEQKNILGSVDHAFFIKGDDKITALINSHQTRIGDIAKCVTGFYSGNDKEFLRVKSSELRNGKKYKVIETGSIATNDSALKENILHGIKGKHCFVPIVKGGNTKYLKQDSWYMNWSLEAVQHYKTNKKARFQNSQYYFKFGIGVPMISSSQITAALIENKLFDQSIVGVFPHDPQYTYFLLAFFNSPWCNTLIRAINPSANNPANYIKKIPFIEPSKKTLHCAQILVDKIFAQIRLSGFYSMELEKDLNHLIEASQNI